MPHAVIEYSENLTDAMIESRTDLVGLVHGVMMGSGLFELSAIKTRAYGVDNWMVGEKGPDGKFIHVAVSLLSGRTLEQKQNLSETLGKALSKQVPQADSVTVEIRDMDKDTYRKYTPKD